jgi:hypothetical protein
VLVLHSFSRRLTALITAILVSSCASPTKTEVIHERKTQSFVFNHEAVVFLSTYRKRVEHEGTEFVHCLELSLAKDAVNPVKIMDSTVFRDALFPWFEPQYAPTTIEALNELLAKPLVRQRITSLGARYLVNISFITSASDDFPGFACVGTGCLGVAWESRSSQAHVAIWDIANGKELNALSVTTGGKSVAAGFVFPVIFTAYTEKAACTALAAELGRLLNNAATPETISR